MLRQLDRPQLYEQVSAQLKQLLSQPKPLVAVVDLISQGKLLKAEDLCRQFMLRDPANVEGMRLLADIGCRLGVLDDAEATACPTAAWTGSARTRSAAACATRCSMSLVTCVRYPYGTHPATTRTSRGLAATCRASALSRD